MPSRLENILDYLLPLSRLRNTPWWPAWREEERRSVLAASRTSLALVMLSSPLHYLLVDVPLQLRPLERWQGYRFGIAAFALLLFLASYLPPIVHGNAYRAPAMLAGLAVSYFQARSMVWYSGISFVYGVTIACIGALILHDTQVRSTLWLAVLFAVQLPAWVATGQEPGPLVSATLIGFTFVYVLRSRMAVDVARFLAERDKLDAQKRMIESEIELNREIRGFLPREIYERVRRKMLSDRLPVLDAMSEVLRPRRKQVACIFSDIRSFTEQSKDLNGYLLNSAVPNIRACTELVEQHRGIPRLIGDLIFSYFDGADPKENLRDALGCAAALVLSNARFNREHPENGPVRRYVLFSYGEAVVGNIGGYESAREITALGPPVNILSRIDPLTKHGKVAAQLGQDVVILTEAAARAVGAQLPDLPLERVDLAAHGATVRDFPEETSLWLLRVHPSTAGLIGRPVQPPPFP